MHDLHIATRESVGHVLQDVVTTAHARCIAPLSTTLDHTLHIRMATITITMDTATTMVIAADNFLR